MLFLIKVMHYKYHYKMLLQTCHLVPRNLVLFLADLKNVQPYESVHTNWGRFMFSCIIDEEFLAEPIPNNGGKFE